MSYASYPAYKHSGVEWLGEVPEHWQSLVLKRVSSIYAGGTPDRTQPHYWTDGTIPWINSGTVNQKLICEASEYITELGFHNSSARWVPTGQLVMALAGQGKTKGMVAQLGIAATCNQSMAAIVCNTRLSIPRYALYLLASQYEQIRFMAGGDNRDGLNLEIVGLIPTLVPPLAEQQAIAAFLDTECARIDTLIERQNRLIELLQEKRQALITQAVTRGLNADVALKHSGVEWLGEVPAHWNCLSLGKVAFMQEGPGLRHWQFVDSGIQVICVTNITDEGINLFLLERFISKDEYERSYKHFTVDNGDILLSSSGNSWGKVAIYRNADRVILNTSTIRLHALNTNTISTYYLKLILQSRPSREQLLLAMTGACQPNFGPTHLKTVRLSLPPLAEQEAIVEYLDAETQRIDNTIAKAQRSIELMQERRSALISAAVTGKIDVRKHSEQRTH